LLADPDPMAPWGEDHASDHGVRGRGGRRPAAIVVIGRTCRNGRRGGPVMIEPFVTGRRTDASRRNPARRQESDRLDRVALDFVDTRSRLLGIAYRILRNPFEAEDIVQDTWLRWQATDRSAVLNADAFLTTTTTRLALNHAQCAQRRHERPAGPWLPDMSTRDVGPESSAEIGDDVERAVLLLLAKLKPAERAAYVLREVFEYPYDRIADVLHLNPANCRQLVRRARQRVASERCRPVSVAAHRRLLEAFLAAARGNTGELEDLLVAGAARAAGRMVGSDGSDPAAA
jgi:RNA polymerase sigma-70 factor, ECF subfamily